MAQTFIVAGLGFGDEGKGTITDYLVRRDGIPSVVRYNGGPQAAHHVVRSDGLVHCFAQFGSGTLVSGVRTYLSKHMLIDPLNLLRENEVLEGKGILDALERLTIDADCLVVTPFQKFLNRMRETSRHQDRHGSCGLGVGETIFDANYLGLQALRAADLQDPVILKEKLVLLQQVKLEQADQLARAGTGNGYFSELHAELRRTDLVDLLTEEYQQFANMVEIRSDVLPPADEDVVFEGAQGVLLDRERGFWPHVTKTRTTFQNALDLTARWNRPDPIRVGVIRAYHTRHGAGPFPTEDESLTVQIQDHHNGTNHWQGGFRVGWFDGVMARYALDIVEGVDRLVVTNLDRLFGFPTLKVCTAYAFEGKDQNLDEFFEWETEGRKKVITRIKIPATPTQDHHQRLTQLLAQCRPVYREVAGIAKPTTGQLLLDEARDYLRLLEEVMGHHISVVSVGPMAGDKINL